MDASPPLQGLSYFICTNPRSGSSLLGEGLRSSGVAGNPAEWFNIDHEKGYRSQWGLKDDINLELFEYLDLVTKHGMTKNRIFGAKIHYYQMMHFEKRLAGTKTFQGIPVSEGLTMLFPEIRYIWLRRRGRILQSISYLRADKTKIWSVAEASLPGARPEALKEEDFDPKAIMEYHQFLSWGEENWRQYFQACGIEPLTLYYEDLVQDIAGSVRTVLAWLGIPDAGSVAIPPPTLKRQSDELTQRWLARYLDFLKESGGAV